MIAILVMMQTLQVSESRKRTTTGGDDATSVGAIALYGLQRDLRQAGYGISDTDLVGCNLALTASKTLSGLSPATINHASIPAGDANSDTLLVVYGSANGTPQGNLINSQPDTTVYSVQSPASFSNNDYIVATPATRAAACSLLLDKVSGVPVAPNVTVTTGSAGMASGALYNLGAAPRVLAYAIRDGNLTQCDFMASDCADISKINDTTVWAPIAGNIVGLRAMYGSDTGAAMDGLADTFDQATPTTACGWMRVSAIRLALLSRSAQYEKDAVTTAAPAWYGSATRTGTVNLPAVSTPYPFDLSAFAAWQHYRYKTFETVIPVRNVTWQGVPTGC